MLGKFFRKMSPRPVGMYDHGYYNRRDLSPEMQAELEAGEAQLHEGAIKVRFEKATADPQTALGKIFPRSESLVQRSPKKHLQTLKLANQLEGYRGLASALQEIAASPLSRQEDRDAQLAERLKAFTKLGQAVAKGEFKAGAMVQSSQEQDTEALLALDRFLTLNKGSGDAQKQYRTQLFMKAARADHKLGRAEYAEKQEASIHGRIDRIAMGFASSIAKYSVTRMGRHTVIEHEPPPPIITDSGIYATIDEILASDKPDTSKWASLRHLYKRIEHEPYDAFHGPAHIMPGNLNFVMRDLLGNCMAAPLSSATRVALMQEALVKFRPAAEYANSKAEIEQWHKASAAKAKAARDEETGTESGTVASPSAREEPSHMRGYRYPAGFEPKWYQKPNMDRKVFTGVLAGGALAVAGVGVTHPDNVRAMLGMPVEHVSSSMHLPPDAPYDANEHAMRLSEQWRARMDAEDARMTRSMQAPAAREVPSYRERMRDVAPPRPRYEAPIASVPSDTEAEFRDMEARADRLSRGEPLAGDIPDDIRRIQREAELAHPRPFTERLENEPTAEQGNQR